MNIAVISDIHGNLEALESILADIQCRSVQVIVSLGDNIGYGANSEDIIQLLQYHRVLSVLGNHEMAVIEPKAMKWFKPNARQALTQAIKSLSKDSLAYIRSLKTSLTVCQNLFVHGFPPHSVRLYLFQLNDTQLLKAFNKLKYPVCFVGHTHKLSLVFCKNQTIHRLDLDQGIKLLTREQKYIINAGSVGQPRDGNPCAKYLIWNSSAYQLETRFIPYDLETAAQKIQIAGIPLEYAERLREQKENSDFPKFSSLLF